MSVTNELMTERQVELADIDNKNDKCVSNKQRRTENAEERGLLFDRQTSSTGAAYPTT